MRAPRYDDVQAWLFETANRLGVDGGCFHLKSRAGDRIVCQAITDGYRATHLSYGLDLSDCAAVLQALDTGDVLTIDDALADGRVAQVARQRFGLKSIMYCPVRLDGAYNGIAIFSRRSVHTWADADRGLVAAAVQALESRLVESKLEPHVSSSSYEVMLGAVPGLVSVVDRDLLTQATSASVRQGHDVDGQPSAVSVDELLRDSDRGPELRSALVSIIRGDLERFQGLFKTAHGTWWVHVRGASVGAKPPPDRVAVVHAQPLPVASGGVLGHEEGARLEALGRIAGTVAHEVNNALQHIGMSLEEIDIATHERQRAAIRAATQRAARVTSLLLTFARRAPNQRASVEPTELVGRPLDLTRGSVGVGPVADAHRAEVVVSTDSAGETPAAAPIPLEGAETEPTADPGATGPRVLIVDDEVEIARLIGRALSLRGYQTKLSASLASARATFEADPAWPDLIIFDINLGDGNGVELFEQAQRDRPGLPCLAISGFADRDAARPLAGCRFLAKPFTPAQLRAEVERMLSPVGADPDPDADA